MKKWKYKKALAEAGAEMNRLAKEVIHLRGICGKPLPRSFPRVEGVPVYIINDPDAEPPPYADGSHVDEEEVWRKEAEADEEFGKAFQRLKAKPINEPDVMAKGATDE